MAQTIPGCVKCWCRISWMDKCYTLNDRFICLDVCWLTDLSVSCDLRMSATLRLGAAIIVTHDYEKSIDKLMQARKCKPFPRSPGIHFKSRFHGYKGHRGKCNCSVWPSSSVRVPELKKLQKTYPMCYRNWGSLLDHRVVIFLDA